MSHTVRRARTMPVVRNDVPRPRLYARLDEASRRGGVLVCAPAGYGKTTLVAGWLAARDSMVIWVPLSDLSGDRSDLWSSILDAAAAAVPTQAAELRAMAMSAGQESSALPDEFARWMADQSTDLTLVLDDLHAVTAERDHEQLQRLVTSVAHPSRVVVMTRHDPPWQMHRVRIEGAGVQELRAHDLAFQVAEVRDLFGQLGLQVPPADLERLQQRTEGWVAGLRLAALGATTSEDPLAFLGSVTGGDRYIADYLMLEVFEQAQPGWRRLLSLVGVVDEVCAELAEALGGGPDSATLLADLARANAFVYEIGDRFGWYRLHPLLLDLLRSRVIDPAAARQLHRRAATWFQDNDRPSLALVHAVAGEHWARAGELVGTHVVTWTVCQSPRRLLRMLSAVPREVVLTEPGLAIGLAAARAMAGDQTDVADLVQGVRDQVGALPASARPAYEFLSDLISAGMLRFSGDLDAALASLRAMPDAPGVLSGLGLTDWLALRAVLLSNRGSCELWTGEEEHAALHLGEAARSDGNRPRVLPMRNAQAHLAYLSWSRGDLRAASSAADAAIDGLAAAGVSRGIQARCAYLARAGVALDRDELDEAARWLLVARDIRGEAHTDVAVELMAARLQGARGQLYEASGTARAALAQAERSGGHGWLMADARRTVADLEMATATADGLRAADDARRTPRQATVRGCVAEAVGELLDAQRAGDPGRAGHALEQALAISEPEELRRPFLDIAIRHPHAEIGVLLVSALQRGTRHERFARDLLDRLPVPERRPGSRAIFVPLTPRELTVLRLMATTLSYQEIAEALHLSINTVKTYQRSIHAKLAVSTRRAAVVHAREIGLL